MRTLLTILLAAQALFLSAQRTAAGITFGGGLETEGLELTLSAYSAGWQGLSVRGDWNASRQGERHFRLMSDGKSYFEGTSRYEQRGDSILGEIRLTCTRDISMQSLSIALNVPLTKNRTRTWQADASTFPIPTGQSESGQLCRCCVPLPDGGLLAVDFPAPVRYLEQDLSRWSDTWSLRIGDHQSPRIFAEGEQVSFRFVLSTQGGFQLRNVYEKTIVQEGSQWVRFSNHKDILPGSALDFSRLRLQHAPAGKYGWLKAGDGAFEFERKPGNPYRFYGVNLCFSANYPTHEVADRLTDRLVRLGYNSIRIHHHDDIWGKGDPEMHDRLDYLLAKAIEKGLYVTTDMYVSRRVTWRELGVDREGDVGMDLFKSLVGCFEPAFQNWCRFAREFLEHRNPYTGRSYKDESGLPLLSLINEGELFMGFDSKKDDPIIQQAYRDFVGRDEPLVYGTPGFHAFADELERRIVTRCSAYLREIGCKALLTNDNNGSLHGDGEGTTPLYDYVDNHFYIDHPVFLDKSWQLPSRCNNDNPVTYGGPGIFKKNYAKGFSKPYTITEWNFSGPGRYRGLGGILTGARAAIQEWDGLWRFAYSHSNDDLLDNPESHPGYFDVASDPLLQASDRASVCLFLRGDASEESNLQLEQNTGVLRLDTKRMCGIYATQGKHTAGILTAEISGASATVCLCSLDGKDLSCSRHMLLTHITDVQGDGTQYADSQRKILLQWGRGMFLERGSARITIATSGTKGYKVYETDTTGRRVTTLSCQRDRQGITFTVSTANDRNEGRIYYEICR
ncbi:MAG: hypothetical protein ACI4B5_08575 [Bacteroidaceae bacterium]